MAQPRTERKRLYNLPVHLARRRISAHLSDDLIKKYGRRSVVLRKGDTVKVMRGDYAGTTGKVTEVNTSTRKVVIEGVTLEKADKTKVARPVDPSNLLITKLDLSDKLRRAKLGASEADVSAEDREPKARKPKKEEKAESEEETAEEETPKPVRGARRKKGETPDDEEEK